MLDLYATGIYDAQYPAGLIADESKMTKKDLANWLAKSNSTAICGFTVAWVAAESKHAAKWHSSGSIRRRTTSPRPAGPRSQLRRRHRRRRPRRS